MRAILEKIDTHGTASFLTQHFTVPGFPFYWHHHPEIELTLIVRGQGRRFVGDSVATFKPGDLVLLGKNLPHTWNSEPRRGESVMRHEAVVVQFLESAFGERFFALPELRPVRRLLDDASRGILFTGPLHNDIAPQLLKVAEESSGRRLVMLLEILTRLAAARPAEKTFLASTGFVTEINLPGERRIADVCRWINEHFQHPLHLTDAARRAHLGISAFSRFFKNATGRTFTHYVNEVRIAQACRLLLDTDRSISRIAYESGFSNLSHFNRRFLRSKRISPRAFRRAYAGSP